MRLAVQPAVELALQPAVQPAVQLTGPRKNRSETQESNNVCWDEYAPSDPQISLKNGKNGEENKINFRSSASDLKSAFHCSNEKRLRHFISQKLIRCVHLECVEMRHVPHGGCICLIPKTNINMSLFKNSLYVLSFWRAAKIII
jgi:hypothetical protein